MSDAAQDVFFDDNNYYDLDSIKKDIYENDEYDEYESADEVSDADAWDELAFYRENDWEEVKGRMVRAAERAEAVKIIAWGNLGLWNRNASGGFISDDIETAVSNILGSDCEPQKIYMEDGDLHFTAVHHDGTNEWIIRAVTRDGNEYWDDWNYYDPDNNPDANLSEPEIHENIFERDEFSVPIVLEWD